jgi:hypothetical protein
VTCAPAYWSIKLPNGKYDVKLTVGDPSYSAAYSLFANGVPVFNGDILKKD